jgi:hypothetical protein
VALPLEKSEGANNLFRFEALSNPACFSQASHGVNTIFESIDSASTSSKRSLQYTSLHRKPNPVPVSP